MADSWIKFDSATPEKPEVWAIAEDIGIDPDAVVGKLLRIWIWFDQQTLMGDAPSVTKKLLDRAVGVPGFCDAVIRAGWMIEENGNLMCSNFDRHNGKTAKKRALTAKRNAEWRAKTNAPPNAAHDADRDAPSVTSASPRVRVRDKEKPTNVGKKKASKKVATLVPALWVPDTALADWFAEQGFEFNIADMTRQFIDGCHAKGLKYVDHRAAFRNWSKNRHERRQATNGGGGARKKSAAELAAAAEEAYARQDPEFATAAAAFGDGRDRVSQDETEVHPQVDERIINP